jgi:hypothetical protein
MHVVSKGLALAAVMVTLGAIAPIGVSERAESFLWDTRFNTSTQWCAYFSDGVDDCSYYTFRQCQTAISGVGGMCGVNPHYLPPVDGPVRRAPRYYR